ncbi:V-type ATP synthase subunit I [Candidatus Woesearchaeota archaeon]|nr:V-type ATP synthase subunit I [Candidatus Woesearchaeota archaeon]
MMQVEKMVKVDILGPKKWMKQVIEVLYHLNVYHMIDHQRTAELDIGSPLEHSEKVSEILVKIRALLSYLQIPQQPVRKMQSKKWTEKEYYELGKRSRELYLKVTNILEEKKKLEEQWQCNKELEEKLQILKKLNVHPRVLRRTSHIAYCIGTVGKEKDLRTHIANITNRFQLVEAREEKQHFLALFIDTQYAEKAKSTLAEHQFAEIDFLSVLQVLQERKLLQKPAYQSLRKIQDEQKMLQEKKESLERKLVALSKQYKEFLLLNEALLSEEAKKASAPLRFGNTKEAFLIHGWVPKARLQEVTKTLNETTKNSIYLEVAEPTKEKEIPIQLKNPKAMQPFEFFIHMFSLPNYKELDPTMLMAFTFPIFFGMMLGDVGYGIVTLALFLFLKKKIPSMKALLNIMVYASLVTILFGFSFGEFFGFEHVSEETGEAWCQNIGLCLEEEVLMAHGEERIVYSFPRLFNRLHGEWNVLGYDMPAVLVIGALIGLLHLNVGLLLGFYNVLIAHGFLHAIYEKGGWLLFEAGVAALIAYFLNQSVSLFAAVAILLLSCLMLLKGEGVKGLIEMPALFSNMLSYMRLGAVGLASVGLAVVVNEQFVIPYIEKGGLFIIVAIVLMVIGHVINIALGIIGPFLHSLRLHYVEFFTKFYHGGGIPYEPFG